MRYRFTSVTVCFSMMWIVVPLYGAAPIPVQNRIPAKVVKYLTATLDPPIHMPTDVAVDRQGRVFVAAGVEHRILRFSAEGKLEDTLRSFGDYQLNRPIGLALDAQDRLWIADSGNSHLYNGRMRGQYFLDLARVDVKTPGDKHIFLSVLNVKIAIAIHSRDIAGI